MFNKLKKKFQARKTRLTNSESETSLSASQSSRAATDDPMDSDYVPNASRSVQPPVYQQTLDPNLPEEEWPEVRLPDMGIEWRKQVHQDHFNLIKDRPIVPSRFIDMEAIETMGILREVKNLTDRIGLWNFLSEPVPTYKRLTLEFLSTLESNDDTVITFQLYGRNYRWSADTINRNFGFPCNENFDSRVVTNFSYHQGYSQNDFLDAIMVPTNSNRLKRHTSNILHPALRYIQRVLSCSIFGRGSSYSKFLQAEVFMMYCMLHPEAPKPDIGYFMIQELIKAKNGTKASGQTFISGIITKIAIATRNTRLMSWSIQVKGQTANTNTNSINLAAFKHMRMVKLLNGRLHHIAPDGKLVRLPYHIPLLRDRPETWIIPSGTGIDNVPNSDPEMPPPRQPSPPIREPTSEPPNPYQFYLPYPEPHIQPDYVPLPLTWYPSSEHQPPNQHQPQFSNQSFQPTHQSRQPSNEIHLNASSSRSGHHSTGRSRGSIHKQFGRSSSFRDTANSASIPEPARQSFYEPRQPSNFEAAGTSCNPAAGCNYDFSSFMNDMTQQMAEFRMNNEKLAETVSYMERSNQTNMREMEELIRSNHVSAMDEISKSGTKVEQRIRDASREIHDHLYTVQQEQYNPNFVLERTQELYMQEGFPVGIPAPWYPTFIPNPDQDSRFVPEGSSGTRYRPYEPQHCSTVFRNRPGPSREDITDHDAYFRPETLAASSDSSSKPPPTKKSKSRQKRKSRLNAL